MTFKMLHQIIKYNNIPEDVHLLSDSGCEWEATEMDGVFYNELKNEIMFTQHGDGYDDSYINRHGWKNLHHVSI